MNLLEFMKQCEEDEEITAFDKDYDLEIYFYGGKYIDKADNWEKSMNKIAECLTVVEELTGRDYPTVVVNLSEMLEKSLENGAMDDLFYSKNIDVVMSEMDLILAGYVSEEWLVDFAEALQAGAVK